MKKTAQSDGSFCLFRLKPPLRDHEIIPLSPLKKLRIKTQNRAKARQTDDLTGFLR
jgi:hypothetical protein